jgi:hypothetical protein
MMRIYYVDACNYVDVCSWDLMFSKCDGLLGGSVVVRGVEVGHHRHLHLVLPRAREVVRKGPLTHRR